MKHGILGEIRRPEESGGDYAASIRYASRDIRIQIIPDDQPLEVTLDLAAKIVVRLGELDVIAKRAAVAQLREAYNNSWNEYDEVQADGSLKTVCNPKLTETEFEKRLSLNAINVTGSRSIGFFYDDSGMFWGHAIVVESLNGIDFSKAHADLFG